MGKEPRVFNLEDGLVLRVLEGESYSDPATGQSLTGAWVWDASIVLASWFASRAWPPGSFQGKRVVELGAGTALPGLTLASLGALVALTDRSPLLAGLEANIKENKLQGRARACELEWGECKEHIPVVLRALAEMQAQQQQQQQQQLQQLLHPRDSASESSPVSLQPNFEAIKAAKETPAVSLEHAGAAGSGSALGSESREGVARESKEGEGCGVDFVIGSDIMYDTEREAIGNLCNTIKCLSGSGTRIFLCCELRPPLPGIFRHMEEHGMRWSAVPQDQLHPTWSSEDIKVFEFFLSYA